MLDLKNFKNSLNALEKSLNVVENNKNFDNDIIEVLQAGVVQNFEVAYETSWKMIKRYLKNNDTPEIIANATKKELFRIAFSHGIIRDVEEWFEFNYARNLTAHEYSLEKAEEVYEYAKRFLKYGKELLERLKDKND